MGSNAVAFSLGFSSSHGGQRGSGVCCHLLSTLITWNHLIIWGPYQIVPLLIIAKLTNDPANPGIYCLGNVVDNINMFYIILKSYVWIHNPQDWRLAIFINTLHTALLSTTIRIGEHPIDSLDPWTTYGPVVTIFIIILRLLSFLALPQVFWMNVCWLAIMMVKYDDLKIKFWVSLRFWSPVSPPHQILFNLVGFLTLNTFKPAPTFKSSPLLSPFVCVRVVTRGIYPNLGNYPDKCFWHHFAHYVGLPTYHSLIQSNPVKKTVRQNMETLLNVGLENFVIQVGFQKKIFRAGQCF